MVNKSGVGVVFVFMVEIVLIIERTSRWQFVWIPSVSLCLLCFLVQYIATTRLLSVGEDLLNWMGFKTVFSEFLFN